MVGKRCHDHYLNQYLDHNHFYVYHYHIYLFEYHNEYIYKYLDINNYNFII